MATLIRNQITGTTASRPGRAMPISAALEMITRVDRSVKQQQDLRPDLLISESSTTNAIGGGVQLESRKPCGNVDSTKGALGMYVAQGAFTTRLGSRPPSPPV